MKQPVCAFRGKFRLVFPLLCRSQSVFSLIELMVTVAIVGLLVSLAGSKWAIQKRKAHQSEAKVALSSIFSLQKAFHAEYSAYVPAFSAIGYSPEGNRRYYGLQFCQTSAWTGTISGFTGSVADYQIPELNTPWPYATAGGVTGGGYGYNCGGTVQIACDAWDPTSNPENYEALATATLCTGCIIDLWRIDQNKRLQNCEVGLNTP